MAGFVCGRCRRLLQAGTVVLRSAVSGSLRGLAAPRPRPLGLSTTRGYVKYLPESISAMAEKRREYSEETAFGYRQEDVYSVVSDLNNYKNFLPWCKESEYIKQGQGKSIGRLVIGFPPLLETYTALVLHDSPQFMRSISTDGRLFSHLENIWLIRPGPDTDIGPTCIVNFWVQFEFRSLLYAQVGGLVFDEVAKTMAHAFEARCVELYGPNHLRCNRESLNQFRSRLREMPVVNRSPVGKDPCGSS